MAAFIYVILGQPFQKHRSKICRGALLLKKLQIDLFINIFIFILELFFLVFFRDSI